jgi:hypothetical protein
MKFYIFSILMLFVLPSQPRLLQDELQPRSVVVIISNADGSPAAGVGMELAVRVPLTRIQCTTDEAGRCELAFGSDEILVNGNLIIRGAGRHVVLFKGPSVEIPIRLTESGLIDIPIDLHSDYPTRTPAQETVTATETPADDPAETATETPADDPAETATETSADDPAETATETPADDSAETATEAPADNPTRTPLWVYLLWLTVILIVAGLGGVGWYYQQGGGI